MKRQLIPILIHILYPLIKIFNLLTLRGKILIFLFHDVNDFPSPFTKQCKISISVSRFNQALSFISRRFSIIDPLDTKVLSREVSQSKNKPIALLTFDDSWHSICNAVVTCNRYGIKPIVFVNGSSILTQVDYATLIEFKRLGGDRGTNLSFADYQGKLMLKSDLEYMSLTSKVVIGSHFFEHRKASELNLEELKDSVVQNDAFGAQLNSYNSEFLAFPHGAQNIDFYDYQIDFLANQTKAKYFFAADSGINSSVKSGSALKRIHLTDYHKSIFYLEYALMRATLLNRKRISLDERK